MCIHREPAYSDIAQRWDLSESERAQDKCILLPLYAQITELEQEAVALALEESLLESVPRAA
jgi:dTDP-4-amino-4,6-dideoxygalactose transaminase